MFSTLENTREQSGVFQGRQIQEQGGIYQGLNVLDKHLGPNVCVVKINEGFL